MPTIEKTITAMDDNRLPTVNWLQTEFICITYNYTSSKLCHPAQWYSQARTPFNVIQLSPEQNQ